jgi:hypothetical protein
MLLWIYLERDEAFATFRERLSLERCSIMPLLSVSLNPYHGRPGHGGEEKRLRAISDTLRIIYLC